MIHVNTGDGKGKTTAALGLALRASGHGKKIIIIQFMKGKINYGELASSKKLGNVEIIQFGRPDFVDLKNPSPEDIQFARDALAHARAAILSDAYDMVVLDEVNVALHARLVPLADVLDIIEKKPARLELVLTGRWAPDEVVARADYVTEMREVAHPFRRGISGREGVEW